MFNNTPQLTSLCKVSKSHQEGMHCLTSQSNFTLNLFPYKLKEFRYPLLGTFSVIRAIVVKRDGNQAEWDGYLKKVIKIATIKQAASMQ